MSNEEIITEVEKGLETLNKGLSKMKQALSSANQAVLQAEAYNKGLNDAWELADKINNMPMQEVIDVYGFITDRCSVFKKITPQEALAKLEAYEKSKEIKVGDVVESINTGRIGVITKTDENGKYVMFSDGTSGMFAHDDIRKTGKHIDITSVLEQLKGE